MQFISLISGDTSIHVGHGLESETSEIQVVRFVDPKSRRRVVIVDTPGFDDSRRGVTDTDILKKIAKFLLEQWVISVTPPFIFFLLMVII